MYIPRYIRTTVRFLAVTALVATSFAPLFSHTVEAKSTASERKERKSTTAGKNTTRPPLVSSTDTTTQSSSSQSVISTAAKPTPAETTSTQTPVSPDPQAPNPTPASPSPTPQVPLEVPQQTPVVPPAPNTPVTSTPAAYSENTAIGLSMPLAQEETTSPASSADSNTISELTQTSTSSTPTQPRTKKIVPAQVASAAARVLPAIVPIDYQALIHNLPLTSLYDFAAPLDPETTKRANILGILLMSAGMCCYLFAPRTRAVKMLTSPTPELSMSA